MKSTFTSFEWFIPRILGAAPVTAKNKKNGNCDKMKTVLCKSDMFLMICQYMYGTYKINHIYQCKQTVFSISFMKRKPKYLQTNVPVYNIHFKILR